MGYKKDLFYFPLYTDFTLGGNIITKYLFLINGLGLGNSSRCYSIIQRLYEPGTHIEVATSGNGRWFFSDKHEIAQIHKVESFEYGSTDGKISIVRTLASLIKIRNIYQRNTKKLHKILEENTPKVVITDSDYCFSPVKKFKIPTVALNNADVVFHSYRYFKNKPSSIRAQFYFVEMMDYFFHKNFHDLVLSPCLLSDLPKPKGNFRRIGPIVRKGFQPRADNDSRSFKVTIMLSGSVFGSPVVLKREDYPVHIDVIGRDAPLNWIPREKVVYHGKVRDSYPFLRNADLVIINGGFSAVSEAFCMRLPMVVIPVPKHAEQWVNGKTIEHLGVGMMAEESSLESALFQALDRLELFQSGYRNLEGIEDGAAMAAKEIACIGKMVTRS